MAIGRQAVGAGTTAPKWVEQHPSGQWVDPVSTTDAPQHRWLWLPGALTALALSVLALQLFLPITNPLRGDELTTLFRYINGGPSTIWHGYITNDHVLYALLTWSLRGLTGDHSFYVERVWSVVPALAAVVLLAWWTWKRLDPWIAAAVTVLVAVAPAFVEVVSEARGYGIASLATVLMLIGSDGFLGSGERRQLAVLAAGAIIGIWTLPVMVAPFIAFLILLWVVTRARRELLVVAGIVALASLLFYLPILTEVIHARGQPGGRQLGLTGFVTRPIEDQLQPAVQGLTDGMTLADFHSFVAHLRFRTLPAANLGQDLLAAAVLLAGIVALAIQRRRFLAAACLVPMFFTYLALELARSYIVSRFGTPLLLPVLLLCACGIVWILRLIRWRPGALALAAAGVALALVALRDGYALATYNGNPTPVLMVSNDPGAFNSYFDPQLMTHDSPQALQGLLCDDAAPFVFLEVGNNFATPQGANCLASRQKVKIAAVSIKLPNAVVPGAVLDVPGGAGVTVPAR